MPSAGSRFIQVRRFATARLNSFPFWPFICPNKHARDGEMEIRIARKGFHCSGPLIGMARCHRCWKVLTHMVLTKKLGKIRWISVIRSLLHYAIVTLSHCSDPYPSDQKTGLHFFVFLLLSSVLPTGFLWFNFFSVVRAIQGSSGNIQAIQCRQSLVCFNVMKIFSLTWVEKNKNLESRFINSSWNLKINEWGHRNQFSPREEVKFSKSSQA